MFNVITETMLYDYFSVSCIAGRFFSAKPVFMALCDAWGVDEATAQNLFEISEHDLVKEILTYDDYTRFRRLKHLRELNGLQSSNYTTDEEIVISIKGECLRFFDEVKLVSDDETTVTSMQNALVSAVRRGHICALRVLGFMQCEGIACQKDLNDGIACLQKALQWGDISSAMFLLKYSLENRVKTIELLNASAKDSPYENMLEIVRSRYGIDDKKEDESIPLLRSAITLGKIDKEKFNPLFARFAHSPLVSIADKKKIALAEDGSLLSKACDLPLNLKRTEIIFDASALEKLPFSRTKEKNAIATSLACAELRDKDIYRPLCIRTSSGFVSQLYVDAIKEGFKGLNVQVIDMSVFGDMDAKTDGGNIFARLVKEDVGNVFILVMRGDIDTQTMRLATEFLNCSTRSNLELATPSIYMDFSEVLVMAVCDMSNARRLTGVVDVVDVAPINIQEKASVIRKIFEARCAEYALKRADIKEDALELLCARNMAFVSRVIDKFVCEQMVGIRKTHSLDADMVERFAEQSVNGYGFGGSYEDD